MDTRTLGTTGPARLRPRPRLHGHVRLLRPGRRGRVARHDPRRARRGRDPARHRRLLRDGPQRAAARATRCADAAARTCRSASSSARCADPDSALARLRRPAAAVKNFARVLAAAARHRPHRRLPAGPPRPGRADRGHRRRDRRADQGRLRPPHRALRGRRRDDAPRARGAPDRRPPDRVLADLARHRGDILPTARELGIGVTAYGVLSRGLLSGHWRADRELSRDRLPRPQPALPGREPRPQPRAGRRAARSRRRQGASVAQVAIAWALSRGDDIVPLVGARRRDRLAEALGALESRSTTDDLAAIEAARAGRLRRRRALRRGPDGPPGQRALTIWPVGPASGGDVRVGTRA